MMSISDNLLSQMREQFLKIDKLQLAFEKEGDKRKIQDFVKQRDDYRNNIYKLEKQDLERIFAKMQHLEAELKQAIKSLDSALTSLESTVNILSSIQKITSIVARIVTII